MTKWIFCSFCGEKLNASGLFEGWCLDWCEEARRQYDAIFISKNRTKRFENMTSWIVEKTYDFTTVKAEIRVLVAHLHEQKWDKNPLFTKDRLIEDARFLLNKIFDNEKIYSGTIFKGPKMSYNVSVGNEDGGFNVELQTIHQGDIVVIETGEADGFRPHERGGVE